MFSSKLRVVPRKKGGGMSKWVGSISSCLSLFSAVVLVISAVAAFAPTKAQAQTFSTIYTFCSGGLPCLDGSNPTFGGLIQGTDGNFYGTTYNGGEHNNGSVFRLTPGGTLTTLYSFCKLANCVDGSNPFGSLVQGSDGNFYGTTSIGGSSSQAPGSGWGTVFQVAPDGTFKSLYSFGSQPNLADGASQYSGLIEGSDGNFYGTTTQGGTSVYNTDAWGTVFRITPTGTLTTIYNFCSQNSCTDGGTPGAPLVFGSDGNLYGTTVGGGNDQGAGTAFKLTPTGVLTTLYTFCSQQGCTDGANPAYGGLVQANDGNLYGTTINGGASGEGEIFRISSTGSFAPLYSFSCSQNVCPNGTNPYGGLIQSSDGNLYGTTTNGGVNNANYGTVFKLTLDGTLTSIYSFCSQVGCTDGYQPYDPVVEGSDGNLYGMTYLGGAQYGTVFSVATGLQTSTPGATLSSSSINFGMFQVGGLYAIPKVHLTNSGTGPLTITNIQITGTNASDFSESDDCPISPNTLGTGLECTISPDFTPGHLGILSAAVNISDNAAHSPQSISLSGTAVDFSVSALPVSNTIKGGKAATYTIAVTPLGGNTLNGSLSVTGCPANASCTLSSSQFALKGTTASTSTLTVKGNGKTPSGNFSLKVSALVFTVTHSTTVGLVVQ
jgi:uncharacterized repeat protein (TIGR03803 family)